jgi:GNAT superfamily N-acetyltransferase
MNLEIVEVDPGDGRVAPLVAALRAELDGRYPEEIAFAHPTVREAARFLLASVDGAAVGCCAVQPLADADSELKRMYVVPGLRGRGIAGRLMAEAERLAARLGRTRIKLETGVRQPEAIAVYERAGFHRIPTYPPYDGWDLSVCYAKPLRADSLAA